jgi:site-specific DNA-methyltransferase (adenine-specific)
MSQLVPGPTSQLRLPLDGAQPIAPALPGLPLVPEWHDQSRAWPHALHATCTYLGSLPPTIAHDLVARWSRPGDVVLDPFCGRGSVPLQACLERRVGIGVDRNPLAAVLTGAAIDPPSTRELHDRLAHLRIDWSLQRSTWAAEADAMGAGSPAALFHRATLAQLLFVRSVLDRRDPTDRALLAALAGILHGRRASAITDAMPNVFSMAPGYATRWLAARGTPPPERDVLALLTRRVGHLRREGLPTTRGIAIEGDAREAGRSTGEELRAAGLPDRIRLVVTSPPYLGLVRYGMANWLRLWLLGEDPGRVDATLDAPRSMEASAALLREVLDDLRPMLTDDAIVVLVLGTVTSHRGRPTREPLELAAGAWEGAAAPAGYHLAGIALDSVERSRKLTRLWGERAGAASHTDGLLVIAPTEAGRRRALAGSTLPTDWARTRGVASGPPDRRRAAVGSVVDGTAILGSHAADVPPGRSRVDGPAGPHEEPRPRPDDRAAAVVHPPAAGAPVRP